MTRRQGNSLRHLTGAALALGWLAAAPAPAAADDASADTAPARTGHAFSFGTEDLEAEHEDWFSSRHFHFAKKAGFGYTRRVKVGEHALSIGVRGPVMPRQKAVGLNFRIRF